MFNFKRPRMSSSEDKQGETDQKLENESATPTAATTPELPVCTDSDTTESLLRTILQKVSILDDVCKKVNDISEKVTNIEKKMKNLDTRLIDLENGVEFLENEVTEMKENMGEIRARKADYEYVNEIRKNVVDLVNRSKEKNIILHGIPEGEEGEDCASYTDKFLATNLNIHEIEIERAHRTPRGRHNTAGGSRDDTRPRPIHVKLLRFADRQFILKSSSALKDIRIRGSKVGISDDVHKATREEHKQLMVTVKKMRQDNKFAFIPYSVPRVIKYKTGPKDAPGPLKTLRLSDIRDIKNDKNF